MFRKALAFMAFVCLWTLTMTTAGAQGYGPEPLGVIRTVEGSRSFVRERPDEKSELTVILDPNTLLYYYGEQIGANDRVWYQIWTEYGWGWISSGRAVKVQKYGSPSGYGPYDNGDYNGGNNSGYGYSVFGAIGPAWGPQGQQRQGCVVVGDGGRSTVRRAADDKVDNIGYVNPGEIHYWYDSKIGTTDAVWYLIYIENPIYPGDNWGWISGRRVTRY